MSLPKPITNLFKHRAFLIQKQFIIANQDFDYHKICNLSNKILKTEEQIDLLLKDKFINAKEHFNIYQYFSIK